MSPDTSQETETTILAECNHVKASGLQCHAIAMRSHRFCYFHARAAQRKRIQYNVFSSFRTEYAHHPESLPKHSTWQDCTAKLFDALDLPTIEDASSLVVFYNALIHATANQMISERRGATIHRMLRSCFVVLDKLELERRPVENQTQSVFIADPEPLADPYAPQFTMEHVIKVEEPTEEVSIEDGLEDEVENAKSQIANQKSQMSPDSVIPSECGTAALGCADESRDSEIGVALESDVEVVVDHRQPKTDGRKLVKINHADLDPEINKSPNHQINKSTNDPDDVLEQSVALLSHADLPPKKPVSQIGEENLITIKTNVPR